MVENYPIIRATIEALLNRLIGEVDMRLLEDTAKIAEAITEYTPDVLVLSTISQVTTANFLLASEIADQFSSLPIIIIDPTLHYELALNSLNIGLIKGYITKEDSVNELATCLQLVSNGRQYHSQSITDRIIEQIKHFPVGKVQKVLPLSKREMEIAQYLSAGETTGVIATKLSLKSTTISTVKLRIYEKLAVNNVISLSKKISALY